jgi:hypothetical protein
MYDQRLIDERLDNADIFLVSAIWKHNQSDYLDAGTLSRGHNFTYVSDRDSSGRIVVQGQRIDE